ncbi:hypothetical protein AG1IA_05597 [Rhizoctonia solani AG-1 IA]|uniref:Uncharacterized protein n=1 Tax=Thanatephorus cucumeris (strain AG1-IA) TaxID=983506 RepID=L8WQH6_THACA|nr:hypothetical protein AG1IA_05597 [Rhizoctonia solani AG-1 IA]
MRDRSLDEVKASDVHSAPHIPHDMACPDEAQTVAIDMLPTLRRLPKGEETRVSMSATISLSQSWRVINFHSSRRHPKVTNMAINIHPH